MRIYLEHQQTIDKGKGASICYPQGFHLVGDDLGQQWLDERLAQPAADDNQVIESESAKTPATVDGEAPASVDEGFVTPDPAEDESTPAS